jgi:hypothetical protein
VEGKSALAGISVRRLTSAAFSAAVENWQRLALDHPIDAYSRKPHRASVLWRHL